MSDRDALARRWHEMSDHAADGDPFGAPMCNCANLAPRLERLIADAEAHAWPCANYLSPLTCLTASSSEAGRCDWCRGLLADAEAKAEARGRREVREAVEALLTKPSVPKHDSQGHYEGRVGGSEHRTVGKRAWCYQCSEWCYPLDFACPCCEPRIEQDDLRAALTTGDPA